MDIKEYKCPNCGGTVKFDSSSQQMKCPYCDAQFEIAAFEDYQREVSTEEEDNFGWDTSGAQQAWEESDLNEFTTGSCPSCGAELVGDQNTIAMVCPCCGNAQIVQKRIHGLLKPEFVIPFQLEKKAAVEALKKFYQGKRLLPNLFKEENRTGSIQGLYVPFWLFDAKAQAHIQYKATKTKAWSDSRYNYTKIDFYSVIRDGRIGFDKIPVDGSEKMDDAYMDAIEPFDYTKMSSFQSAFLAGYSAEKYDVDAEVSKERANKRIKKTVETEFAKSVSGYASVIPEKTVVEIAGGTVHYALFPVWVLNTKYKEKNYQFIMNGQSGRIVGKLPADPGKIWKYMLMFTGIFGTVFTVTIQLLRIFL
jgi:DNA-directed RNA polymerase subunit RPC12/RpoP